MVNRLVHQYTNSYSCIAEMINHVLHHRQANRMTLSAGNCSQQLMMTTPDNDGDDEHDDHRHDDHDRDEH